MGAPKNRANIYVADQHVMLFSSTGKNLGMTTWKEMAARKNKARALRDHFHNISQLSKLR